MSSVTGSTRDIIKSGINLPVIGSVSIAAIGIIAFLFWMSRRKREIRLKV